MPPRPERRHGTCACQWRQRQPAPGRGLQPAPSGESPCSLRACTAFMPSCSAHSSGTLECITMARARRTGAPSVARPGRLRLAPLSPQSELPRTALALRCAAIRNSSCACLFKPPVFPHRAPHALHALHVHTFLPPALFFPRRTPPAPLPWATAAAVAAVRPSARPPGAPSLALLSHFIFRCMPACLLSVCWLHGGGCPQPAAALPLPVLWPDPCEYAPSQVALGKGSAPGSLGQSIQARAAWRRHGQRRRLMWLMQTAAQKHRVGSTALLFRHPCRIWAACKGLSTGWQEPSAAGVWFGAAGQQVPASPIGSCLSRR